MKKSFEMVDYQLVNLAEVALIVEATFEALDDVIYEQPLTLRNVDLPATEVTVDWAWCLCL